MLVLLVGPVDAGRKKAPAAAAAPAAARSRGPSAETYRQLGKKRCVMTTATDATARLCVAMRVFHLDGSRSDELWYMPAGVKWYAAMYEREMGARNVNADGTAHGAVRVGWRAERMGTSPAPGRAPHLSRGSRARAPGGSAARAGGLRARPARAASARSRARNGCAAGPDPLRLPPRPALAVWGGSAHPARARGRWDKGSYCAPKVQCSISSPPWDPTPWHPVGPHPVGPHPVGPHPEGPHPVQCMCLCM